MIGIKRFIYCTGLALALSLGSSTAVFAVDVGEVGPAFTVASKSGSLSLDQHKGKLVYLDIWASWCTACRQSVPWMSELQKKFGPDGLQVLAINVDEERTQAEQFLGESPVSFLVGFDPEGTVPKLYKPSAMPTSYLLSKSGKVLSVHDGMNESKMHEIEKEIQNYLDEGKS